MTHGPQNESSLFHNVPVLKHPCIFPLFFSFRPSNLDVNQILDILDEDHIGDVDEIYLLPPEGDDSDGSDVSDTEEGEGAKMNKTVLQVNGKQ